MLLLNQSFCGNQIDLLENALHIDFSILFITCINIFEGTHRNTNLTVFTFLCCSFHWYSYSNTLSEVIQNFTSVIKAADHLESLSMAFELAKAISSGEMLSMPGVFLVLDLSVQQEILIQDIFTFVINVNFFFLFMW